jgi:lysophospholipase L1-like esterase
MNKRKNGLFVVATLCCISSFCQQVAVPPVPNNRSVPLNLSASRIYGNGLDGFYRKLASLQKENQGVVRVVHIGDSHIQADYMSGIVRNGLQDAFGNAGRGLVFAYQVARTNAPPDIKSTGNTFWHSNRLARQDIRYQCGVSGFCMESDRPGASFTIRLENNAAGQPQFFKHLKIFTDSGSSWLLRTDSSNIMPLRSQPGDSIPGFHNVLLQNPETDFTLNSLSTGQNQAFYGAVAETDLSGVLYSSIGVNGARYDQYNNTPLFWKQLPALQADLYIISLGTNEAQSAVFDETAFNNSIETFLRKLKVASPNASILITTPVDSYRAGRPNKVLQQLNDFLYRYTSRQNIPLWDMYRVTLGYSASRNWIRKGLMAADKVHFTKDGYQLQGSLLLEVLLRSFNEYQLRRP